MAVVGVVGKHDDGVHDIGLSHHLVVPGMSNELL